MSANEDYALIIFFMVTGIFTGSLSDRLRQNHDMLAKRETSMRVLYEIVKDMAGALSSKEVLESVKRRLGEVVKGKCAIILKVNAGLVFDDQQIQFDEKEKMTANWVLANGKDAGWSTTTLSSSRNLYIPLKSYQEVMGVLVLQPQAKEKFSVEEMSFLYTVGQQLAQFLTRLISQENERKLEHFNHVENIYQSILNLISNQLNPPSKDINLALKELINVHHVKKDAEAMIHIEAVERGTDALVNIIEKISAMAQLSAGLIPMNKEIQSVKFLNLELNIR
jgi:two-component system sensor histidine kinase KdpD